MNWLNRLFKLVLIVATASQITACAKTVTWEEEVLLNTGEVIWVTKEVRYTIKGQPGNPLDLGYVPDFVETTSFKYESRAYTYTGSAKLMLLAISPQKTPTLLARPTANEWYAENNYKCVKPYYVQFTSDLLGRTWTWPEQIDTWTYNLPANLMLNRPNPSLVKQRYTIAEKAQQNNLKDLRLLDSQKINPLYISNHCKGSIKS